MPLLGDEDQAEAPFADLLHQLVGADDRADISRRTVTHDGGRRRVRRLLRGALWVVHDKPTWPRPKQKVAQAFQHLIVRPNRMLRSVGAINISTGISQKVLTQRLCNAVDAETTPVGSVKQRISLSHHD